MKLRSVFALIALFLGCFSSQAEIVSGAVWLDSQGSVIQAHGGGILKHGDTWFWYGEDRKNGARAAGIACYSSQDLEHWKNEGVVCPTWAVDGRSVVPNTPEGYQTGIDYPVLERPKVLYCERTRKFVMWIHMEGKGYKLSSAAVATSKSPTGPFRFVDCFRPIPAKIHRELSKRDDASQMERGSTFRDMTLFKDDDGVGYVIYAAESNYTMHISRLTNDFQNVLQPVLGKTWNRILVDDHREAPAMFKHSGKYYLITSACKGWTPTEARLSVSDKILGPYRSLGNPCRGPKSNITFDSQSTFVLPIDPKKGRFIFMADRWQPKNIGESTYVWQLLQINDSRKPEINWMDRWSPEK